ncbi:hypothetical protein [Paenibacillus thiaminolyticus]|uniref:hypothetical protein n=1 Tax=Paenibacillus thiaminolyticus TaxID=49283 RepID=UPI002543B834|nr:hypothetical protein [Paenibacillus thiaminolyticus]WII40129.1 hypothetical protein O0V01_14025 [Paenibacillus thiaminolyticus]
MGRDIESRAKKPIPGSADVCLMTMTSIEQVIEHLESCGVPIEEGTVVRTALSAVSSRSISGIQMKI